MSTENPFSDMTDEEALASDLASGINVIRQDDGGLKIETTLTHEINISGDVLRDTGGAADTVSALIHERLSLDEWEVCRIIAAKLRAL